MAIIRIEVKIDDEALDRPEFRAHVRGAEHDGQLRRHAIGLLGTP